MYHISYTGVVRERPDRPRILGDSMDNSTQATITWLVGLLLMPGLFYLGLLSLEGEGSLSPYFLAVYAIITYAALYGADRANQMAEQIPENLPAVTLGGNRRESGDNTSDQTDENKGGSQDHE